MKKKPDPSLTPAARGEYREMIKELARQQYIQEKMGTDADFEKLWREAFAESGTSDVLENRSRIFMR